LTLFERASASSAIWAQRARIKTESERKKWREIALTPGLRAKFPHLTSIDKRKRFFDFSGVF
jgi:hypothetical protein